MQLFVVQNIFLLNVLKESSFSVVHLESMLGKCHSSGGNKEYLLIETRY
jgi:hypothetical protein